MKRQLAALAVLALAASALGGCGSGGGLLPEDVESVAITHYSCTVEEAWELDAQGAAALQEFESGARLRRVTFEPGEAPNDAEGFESWVFDVNGGEGGFTYVSNGSGEYVLMDGEWYALENGVPLA